MTQEQALKIIKSDQFTHFKIGYEHLTKRDTKFFIKALCLIDNNITSQVELTVHNLKIN